ncbi:MAG TPA: cytochrome bc complex cytochrome b subunit [Candidatus Angelobacter sp.]|nr:cytochrome bc complex cytochrome b subunit [Candidatus Angelobacter sp.]
MITETVSRWVDSRLHAAKFVRSALNHVFPDHWSFMLGEIALYAFMILLITGTYLALFFHASSEKVIYHGSYHALDGQMVSAAYKSVLHISLDVPAGLLIRQMHHWAALIFLWAILAHLARIFFTAAYRKPREINWIIGLTLLLLALINGFFGYSIADDLLSGTGLRIGYAILLSVPVIGPRLAFLFMGGTIPNPAAIPRMYALHIFLVPALIAGLLALHLGMIWWQLHTNYPGPKRTNRTIAGSRLWPSYAAKSVGLLLLVSSVIAALGAFAQIDPVWIYGPYDPAAIMAGAQPDWYLGWVEGAIRLFPGINLHLGHWLIPELFFPAVLMPSLVFGALYLYPFVEKLFSSDKGDQNVLRLPYQQPFNTALGIGVFVFMLVLLIAGGDDVIAVATGSSVVEMRAILRLLLLVAPPTAAVLTYLVCARIRLRGASSAAAIREISVIEETPDDP